jgi:hypothetical protein
MKKNLDSYYFKEDITMKMIDKQNLITRDLFKKMRSSLITVDSNSSEPLDECGRIVVRNYSNNSEIAKLTDEQKEDLAFYIHRSLIDG